MFFLKKKGRKERKRSLKVFFESIHGLTRFSNSIDRKSVYIVVGLTCIPIKILINFVEVRYFFNRYKNIQFLFSINQRDFIFIASGCGRVQFLLDINDSCYNIINNSLLLFLYCINKYCFNP